ncbi:MAG: hypothetical protein M9918_24265 [Anaerolineae bacterium]|nr:hypothetical protein [Anaerolineae bacterium]
MINPISAESETIADLNCKIDALTAQVAFLAEEARAQQQARLEWSELEARYDADRDGYVPVNRNAIGRDRASCPA